MRRLEYRIDNDFDGQPAEKLLRHIGCSRAIIISLKQPGRLTANGADIRTIDTLHLGDVVAVQLEDEADNLAANPALSVTAVFEDTDVVVYDKPPFMPVHPSIHHYTDTLANYFAAYNPNASFRAVNRLDMNTSGLCVVAKNRLAASGLGREKLPEKTYYAIAQGKTLPHGEIIAPIGRVSDSIMTRCVRDDGQHAHTIYNTLAQNDELSLVEVKLLTGRTHQIRVHFAYIGHPLAGDDLYGGVTALIERQALHCGEISFTHPITGKKIQLHSELPPDMAELAALIKG